MLELLLGFHWAKTRAHERAPPPMPHPDGHDDDDDHNDEAVARAAEKEDEDNQVHVEWVTNTREIPSSSVPRTNATTRRPGTPVASASASGTSRHIGSHGSHGGSSLSSLGSSQGSSHGVFIELNEDDDDHGDQYEGDDVIVYQRNDSSSSSSSRGGRHPQATSQERARRDIEQPDEFDVGLTAAARRRFGTYDMIVHVAMHTT